MAPRHMLQAVATQAALVSRINSVLFFFFFFFCLLMGFVC